MYKLLYLVTQNPCKPLQLYMYKSMGFFRLENISWNDIVEKEILHTSYNQNDILYMKTKVVI